MDREHLGKKNIRRVKQPRSAMPILFDYILFLFCFREHKPSYKNWSTTNHPEKLYFNNFQISRRESLQASPEMMMVKKTCRTIDSQPEVQRHQKSLHEHSPSLKW